VVKSRGLQQANYVLLKEQAWNAYRVLARKLYWITDNCLHHDNIILYLKTDSNNVD
jgi:hypothetical protein